MNKFVLGKGRCFSVVVILVLFTSGCGSKLNTSNYERVRTGMTLAEVEAILGKGSEDAESQVSVPSQSISIPGVGSASIAGMSTSAKVVSWKDGNRVIAVTLMDGKVASKTQVGL